MKPAAFLRPPLLVAFSLSLALNAAAGPLSGKVIVLDPGHATINFQRSVINTGKSTGSFPEHRLTLEIATQLGKILEEQGATVYFTRTRDDYWRQSYSPIEDNKMRAWMANELSADAFIAIHCDWNPSRRFRGVTTFWEKPQSRKLGELIQRRLVQDLGTSNRGVIHDSFTVLDQAKMPAVLVECGFMSNRAEGKKLAQPEYQRRVALALASAVTRFFSK